MTGLIPKIGKAARAALALAALAACGPAAPEAAAARAAGPVPARLAAAGPGGSFTIELARNEAAAALGRLTLKGRLALRVRDGGGPALAAVPPAPLAADLRKRRAEPGDVMLGAGGEILLFREPGEGEYARLGRIGGADPAALKDILQGDETEMTVAAEGAAGKAPALILNSGYAMPVLGLGTYALTGKTCEEAVYGAIRRGYRLIDTAHMYRNEREVGRAARRAVAEGLATREELFVITKLYPNQYDDPGAAIEEALAKLDLGYIDLMLLHHPGRNDVKAYREIEKYVKAGKIRSAGLSNWYARELEAFLPRVKVYPALVQNEVHPYYQERETAEYIARLGITLQSWYPLGGRGRQAGLLADPVLAAIAEKHGKTIAQVILRWNAQRGIVPVPGSGDPRHQEENIDIFDFVLSDAEMAEIAALDRGEKHDWY